MSAIHDILTALDERNLARTVTSKHDDARVQFALRSNTVGSFREFTALLGRYYNHHFSACLSRGARLLPFEAEERAKLVVEGLYRKLRGDLSMAFNDARDSTNGGIRVILDGIADALKEEAVENYTRSVFDRYVSPVEWDEKVGIIREFIAECGLHLSPSIHAQQPERYAHDYRELIRAFTDNLRQTSRLFRRL